MSLNCKEVSRIVSEGLDRELPAEARARLHAHLAICRGCASLSERFAFLRRAMTRLASRDEPGER